MILTFYKKYNTLRTAVTHSHENGEDWKLERRWGDY